MPDTTGRERFMRSLSASERTRFDEMVEQFARTVLPSGRLLSRDEAERCAARKIDLIRIHGAKVARDIKIGKVPESFPWIKPTAEEFDPMDMDLVGEKMLERELDAVRVAKRLPKTKTERHIQPEVFKAIIDVDKAFLVVRVNSHMHWTEERRRKDGSIAPSTPIWSYRVVNNNQTSGHADGYVVYHGRIFMVEVKTPTGVQTQEQKKFEQLCRSHGIEYVILRSKDEATRWATKIKEMMHG